MLFSGNAGYRKWERKEDLCLTLCDFIALPHGSARASPFRQTTHKFRAKEAPYSVSDFDALCQTGLSFYTISSMMASTGI